LAASSRTGSGADRLRPGIALTKNCASNSSITPNAHSSPGRHIGAASGEAHALVGLARCARAEGRTAEAEAGLRQALALFQRIGAAEAADVSAELDALPGAPGPAPASP
jgi:hypothetical protein